MRTFARNPYYRGPVTANFDGRRFVNPGPAFRVKGMADVLRWKMSSRPARWPAQVPVEAVVPEERVPGLRITMVGHATLLIQAANLNVLTDPVWSERASPLAGVGPRRATRPGIAFNDLPPIDAILLSHNHFDHLDLATMRRLRQRFDPVIVTPLGNDAILASAVPGARVLVGDWWDSIALGKGATAHIVPAYHWSARTLRDRCMALWGGFVLNTPAGAVYFAGDTGYGSGDIFRAIRQRCGAPDIALIPIGAYAPQWFMGAQHVTPEEAVQIMLDVGAGRALGIHWQTFQMSDEAIDEPAARLLADMQARRLAPETFQPARAGMVFDYA